MPMIFNFIYARSNVEVEASWTYRGHSKEVFAIAMAPGNDMFYSGGADCEIRSWKIAPVDVDKFSNVSLCNFSGTSLIGHTDVVWSLATHSTSSLLLSASADGTCRLWNLTSMTCVSTILHPTNIFAIPTCAEFLRNDLAKCIVSYHDGSTHIFDIQNGRG